MHISVNSLCLMTGVLLKGTSIEGIHLPAPTVTVVCQALAALHEQLSQISVPDMVYQHA